MVLHSKCTHENGHGISYHNLYWPELFFSSFFDLNWSLVAIKAHTVNICFPNAKLKIDNSSFFQMFACLLLKIETFQNKTNDNGIKMSTKLEYWTWQYALRFGRQCSGRYVDCAQNRHLTNCANFHSLHLSISTAPNSLVTCSQQNAWVVLRSDILNFIIFYGSIWGIHDRQNTNCAAECFVSVTESIVIVEPTENTLSSYLQSMC